MQRQFAGGCEVRDKSDDQRGIVIGMKFASKSPYHVKELQVNWDCGLTTWIKVSEVV